MLAFANQLVDEKKTNRRLMVASFDRRIARAEEARFLKGLLAGMRRKEMLACVALAGGELVGLCTLKRGGPADLRHTGVLGIVLLAGHRGEGIGERLMVSALRKARAEGVQLVEPEVAATNSPALALYEKLGFLKVGTVPGKISRDGELFDIVRMYLDLREPINPSLGGRRKVDP